MYVVYVCFDLHFNRVVFCSRSHSDVPFPNRRKEYLVYWPGKIYLTELELSISLSTFFHRVVPSFIIVNMIVGAEMIISAVFFLFLTEGFPGIPGNTSRYLCPLDVAD